MQGDIDAIMDHSLIDEPVYEFYPNRIRLSGKKAVRRYHELNHNIIIEQVDPRNGNDTVKYYSLAFGENTYHAECGGVLRLRNGTEKECFWLAVVPFQDGKMAGERVYMDKDMAEFFEESLGADFFQVPGVERF